MTIDTTDSAGRTGLVNPERAREVTAQIGQCAAACRSAGRSLHPAFDLVRESGLGAIRVPVPDGGAGCSVREFFAMLMDLAELDPDVAHSLRAHYWFVEERLRSRDAVERARWIKRAVAGEIFGIAATELGGGDAVGSYVFASTIVPNDAGYLLNGTKFYCTGSLYADWIHVIATSTAGGLVSAVVPVGRSGVVLEDDWDGIGQCLTASGTARFTDVVVRADEVLAVPLESGGGPTPQDSSASYLVGQFCQLYLTAIIAGVLRTVASDAVALVRGRTRTFSHGCADTAAADPLLQQVVGEIACSAFAAEAMILAAAQAQDAVLAAMPDGAPDTELAHHASMRAAQSKVVIDDLAARAADALFHVGGASAIQRSAGLDRHWRNIRTLAAHNPAVYKARSVGNYLVTGERLPINGFF